MFDAVASGNLDLDITLLGNQPRFLVGALVEVSRRKQEGVNEEGGAAKVERVRGDASGGFLYDVRYIIRAASECGLPESFLSKSIDLSAKKRRASLEAGCHSIEGSSHVALYAALSFLSDTQWR